MIPVFFFAAIAAVRAVRKFAPRRFPDVLLCLDVAYLLVLIPLLGPWLCLVCLLTVPVLYFSVRLLRDYISPGRMRTGIFLAGWATVIILLCNTAFFRIPVRLPRWPILFMGLKVIQYGWDVLEGRIENASLRRLAHLLLFFPTLFWGPIERYQHLVPQVSKPVVDPVTREETLFGLRHLGEGLLKVSVSGAIFYFWPQYTFDLYKLYGTYTFLEVLVSTWLIILSFFFVVAGYSDVVIGLSRFMGIEIFENFANPYMQRNFPLFWRAWHKSYSFWLRDYVYIRLGGNRTGVYRNLMITFLLSGISHGLDPKFVIWGTIAALGVCVQRVWREFWTDGAGAGWRAVKEWAARHQGLTWSMGTFITFHFFTLSMMIFFGGVKRGTEVILTVLSLGLIKQAM